MKKIVLTLFTALAVLALAACSSTSGSPKDKEVTLGATAGPYTDMVNKAIKPSLEKKGYKVKVIEFSDYIQPNLALSKGDLDANLFQHKVYMENFAKEKNLKLSEVIIVPTAPMGLYSNKFKSVDEIKEGSTLAIPNDPVNLARTLIMLEDAGLITIKENVNQLTASEKDVKDNPKNLKFKPLEAAQLPRAVQSADLAAVPGNFALAAKMDLLDAIQLENMPDTYRNRVVVNTKDLKSEFAKDIKEVVESKEFEKVIDEEFKGFGKPEWMKK
ncbi:MetQ/NlpA family ABC transporter substrate-binding protein [Fictibacillus phosphorivorans]|uniref:MetQ/NlpA family ABC transporter substrate-binding protein n=1 Tax=Fictibacillus phosphorivorans TaxID=1221500 RepID=UPI002041FA09|nr:MetQ/NlpA family ABC transporter substrate-binding protein [Fictibacillus phosphorivorans]MCM3720278.1 MetQ/NlpA family ABC transporter substrate-binding protein [Fictibacillus phosphorivorans]MCM3777968.1 MetQ/NlpA family ABC transporter substrate-binding protein [Fictibacillus phosphorivorans]